MNRQSLSVNVFSNRQWRSMWAQLILTSWNQNLFDAISKFSPSISKALIRLKHISWFWAVRGPTEYEIPTTNISFLIHSDQFDLNVYAIVSHPPPICVNIIYVRIVKIAHLTHTISDVVIRFQRFLEFDWPFIGHGPWLMDDCYSRIIVKKRHLHEHRSTVYIFNPYHRTYTNSFFHMPSRVDGLWQIYVPLFLMILLLHQPQLVHLRRLRKYLQQQCLNWTRWKTTCEGATFWTWLTTQLCSIHYLRMALSGFFFIVNNNIYNMTTCKTMLHFNPISISNYKTIQSCW